MLQSSAYLQNDRFRLSPSELEQLEHKNLEEVIPMWPEKMEKLAKATGLTIEEIEKL